MTRKQYLLLIVLLGSLSTVSPFSIDMYLPAFPEIARDLSTSIASVQLSLTSYFIGIAAGQMLYGPLLDRFGRTRPLFVGLAVYVLASIGCAFTGSAESLIAMRFFQALGGCAGMVASQTLVRDLFPVNKVAQALSLMTLVVAISPMLAPAIGGYMTVAFGWHSVFIILAIITAALAIAGYFLLPRGRKPDPSISLRPKAVVKNFYGVMRQPQFLVYTLTGGFAAAAPFAYIAGSSDVFINQYGFTPQQYGWIFAWVAGIIIGCTQLNLFLLRKYTSQQVVKVNISVQALIGTLLLVGAYFGWFGSLGLIAMISLFLAGHGITNANANALALAPFTKHTGSAASLGGSFRMAMGGVASALVSAFHNDSAFPMIAVMVGCVLVGFIILVTAKITIRYRARRRDLEKKASIFS